MTTGGTHEGKGLEGTILEGRVWREMFSLRRRLKVKKKMGVEGKLRM